jgi:hypothetical protein
MNNLLAQAGGKTITNPVLGPNWQGLVSSPTGGASFISLLVPKLITMLFVAGVIIFFFMFVWGGIQWITAGGDKNAVADARARLTNALIGMVIVFSAYGVIMLLETFFGITLLTLDIGALVIQ